MSVSVWTTDGDIQVDGCDCPTCQLIRAEKVIAAIRADNDDLGRRLKETLAEARAERDAKHATAEHRDRLIEDLRGLRAEVERLKGEADNAVRVAFERGRHMAELLAERGELRKAIRESAAPLRPSIGD